MRRICLWVVLFWLSASSAFSQETRVVTEALPPFTLQEGDRIGGMATEMVQTVFESVGLSPSIQVVPWARALETAQTTPGVFIYSMARNAEREARFEWVGRLVDIPLTLYRLRDRPEVAAKDLTEVRALGRVIVINRDAAMQRLKALGHEDSHLFILPDRTPGDQRVRLIESRRAEYIVTNPYSFAWRIKTGEFPDIFAPVLTLPGEDSLYLAAHKETDPELLRRLRAAFAQAEAEGVLAQIAARYR